MLKKKLVKRNDALFNLNLHRVYISLKIICDDRIIGLKWPQFNIYGARRKIIYRIKYYN